MTQKSSQGYSFEKENARLFGRFGNIAYICSRNCIIKEVDMTQNAGLNQAQMDFLRLLSHFTTEEEVRELNDLVCKYYAQKVDEEMERLWQEGKWSQEKIEETLKEHLRTPYNV